MSKKSCDFPHITELQGFYFHQSDNSDGLMGLTGASLRRKAPRACRGGAAEATFTQANRWAKLMNSVSVRKDIEIMRSVSETIGIERMAF